MPITTVTTVKVICDICGLEVVGNFVDARVYGKVFHPKCWSDKGGPDLAGLLDLDEIRMRNKDQQEVPGGRFGRQPQGQQ